MFRKQNVWNFFTSFSAKSEKQIEVSICDRQGHFSGIWVYICKIKLDKLWFIILISGSKSGNLRSVNFQDNLRLRPPYPFNIWRLAETSQISIVNVWKPSLTSSSARLITVTILARFMPYHTWTGNIRNLNTKTI